MSSYIINGTHGYQLEICFGGPQLKVRKLLFRLNETNQDNSFIMQTWFANNMLSFIPLTQYVEYIQTHYNILLVEKRNNIYTYSFVDEEQLMFFKLKAT
jgi:hypothetical protein